MGNNLGESGCSDGALKGCEKWDGNPQERLEGSCKEGALLLRSALFWGFLLSANFRALARFPLFRGRVDTGIIEKNSSL